MKKGLIVLFLFGIVSFAKAQWIYRNIDNGLDRPYKIAFTPKNNGAFLKMENVDGKVIFYLQSDYFCNETVDINFSFFYAGKWERFSFESNVSSDHTCVWLEGDLENETDFLRFFLGCTDVRLRVNYYDSTCETKIYDFDMTNSTKAFSFMRN
jgi:hypothetical protein